MGTRCLIGIMKDGDIRKSRCIWCHKDGYPEFTGAILNAHYRSVSKIEKLLALGDIFALGEKVIPSSMFENTHCMNTPAPFTTIAYYRDVISRDEKLQAYKKASSKLYDFQSMSRLDGVKTEWVFVEWVYLFNPKTLRWDTYSVEDISGDYKKVVLKKQNINYQDLIKNAIVKGFIQKPKNG